MILPGLGRFALEKGNLKISQKDHIFKSINALTSLVQVNKSVDKIRVSTGSPFHRRSTSAEIGSSRGDKRRQG